MSVPEIVNWHFGNSTIYGKNLYFCYILTLRINTIKKMVVILTTSGLPDGVNYALEYKCPL